MPEQHELAVGQQPGTGLCHSVQYRQAGVPQHWGRDTAREVLLRSFAFASMDSALALGKG